MIDYELQDLIFSKNLEDLTSEDLMKLFEKPYLISTLADVYHVSEQQIKDIKHKRGIDNVIFETAYRNVIAILFYSKSRNYDLYSSKATQFINWFIEDSMVGMPQRQYYVDKLKSIDWLNLNIDSEIENRNIDIQYRYNNLYSTLNAIDNMLIDYGKNIFLYKKMWEEKKQGKVLKKEDLTYDILYTLSIKENYADGSIGDLFDLSKSQVRSLRKKYDLENTHLKRKIDFPEDIIDIFKNAECNQMISQMMI